MGMSVKKGQRSRTKASTVEVLVYCQDVASSLGDLLRTHLVDHGFPGTDVQRDARREFAMALERLINAVRS
jgi:hypothetical protein